MKKKIILPLAALFMAACSNEPKDFSTVTTGMTKQEVVRAAGEPGKKQDIEIAELWTYPAYDRTVVFRKDTVYDIITSADARTDSIRTSIGKMEEKLKSGTKKLGGKIDSTFERLDDRFKRDTN